jgi:FMN-dependent NADH-azoreductase
VKNHVEKAVENVYNFLQSAEGKKFMLIFIVREGRTAEMDYAQQKGKLTGNKMYILHNRGGL